MWKITVLFTVFIVVKGILAVSQPELPCESQLRNVQPELFKHCSNCSYSQWSSWKVVERLTSTTCASGKAFKQIRTRHDHKSVCDQQSETNHTCKTA